MRTCRGEGSRFKDGQTSRWANATASFSCASSWLSETELDCLGRNLILEPRGCRPDDLELRRRTLSRATISTWLSSNFISASPGLSPSIRFTFAGYQEFCSSRTSTRVPGGICECSRSKTCAIDQKSRESVLSNSTQ